MMSRRAKRRRYLTREQTEKLFTAMEGLRDVIRATTKEIKRITSESR